MRSICSDQYQSAKGIHGDVIAIYDVKTGGSVLSASRADQLRDHTGAGPYTPVIELHFHRGSSLKHESVASDIFAHTAADIRHGSMRGLLVIKPTNYMARGFLLDTTSRRDHMKLWRVVMPLHRPLAFLSLTHSEIIMGDHAGLVQIDKKAYGQSAAIVLKKIIPHVEPLRQLGEPRDFLKYISWMSGNRMLNIRMDFRLTHYLLGNTPLAIEIFRNLSAEIDLLEGRWQGSVEPTIRQIMHQLETDPPGLLDTINKWRDQNIEVLGLSASRAAKPKLGLVNAMR